MTDMINAIKECIEEGREVTYIGTLLAAIARFNYYWDNFTRSTLSVIKEDINKLCK
jgi:hypothetical protein